jgi:hypothetical protein
MAKPLRYGMISSEKVEGNRDKERSIFDNGRIADNERGGNAFVQPGQFNRAP